MNNIQKPCEVCQKPNTEHYFCNNCVRRSKIYDVECNVYRSFYEKVKRREVETITHLTKCQICNQNSFIYYFVSICGNCRQGVEETTLV